MTQPLLECREITKRFGGVVALRGVSFDLRPGEIHALCGENGAGKSTLIKVLGGIHPHGSFDGELQIDGRPVHLRHTADATANGIAVIYQELALVEEMTVAENIYLGKEPRRLGFVDWPAVYGGAAELLKRFAIDLRPDARVADLGVGQRQLVEIVKALAAKSRILILDEPTAALSEHEVRVLLDILRDLRRHGVACAYISHRLDEVFALADRITVLRDGATVSTSDAAATTTAAVIRAMVGREIATLFPRRASHPGKPLLRVERLDVAAADRRSNDRLALAGIDLEVREGEVLGIGGLMGAGRSELLMHLFGAWGKRVGGRVYVGDTELDGKPESTSRSIRAGMVLVSEDRKRYGLLLQQTVAFNLTLSSLPDFARARGGVVLDHALALRTARASCDALRVKTPSLDATVAGLSGGNQQKVVLGKALMTRPRVLLLDEPTRGIDVGAKQEVYELINQLTEAGHAVVLVSSELPELMAMSDRVVMLHEGRIGGAFTRAEATAERLLAAAMGHDVTA